jgi:hypothetical protein
VGGNWLEIEFKENLKWVEDMGCVGYFQENKINEYI